FKGEYPTGTEWANLMVSYDCLVLCSTDTEGLPLTLLESMAYGLPFVTTDVGAIRDCCINNPDVVLVLPNFQSIKLGLEDMKEKLDSKVINHKRLKQYYVDNFSQEIMESRWRTFINNPRHFFL
ncbi:MAG: glycosyltransferase, partial [Cytophagales bacterium]|nr:glycosyltransferase [Cytophagales bacterium]